MVAYIEPIEFAMGDGGIHLSRLGKDAIVALASVVHDRKWKQPAAN